LNAAFAMAILDCKFVGTKYIYIVPSLTTFG
jgi:hypothetical protein